MTHERLLAMGLGEVAAEPMTWQLTIFDVPKEEMTDPWDGADSRNESGLALV